MDPPLIHPTAAGARPAPARGRGELLYWIALGLGVLGAAGWFWAHFKPAP